MRWDWSNNFAWNSRNLDGWMGGWKATLVTSNNTQYLMYSVQFVVNNTTSLSKTYCHVRVILPSCHSIRPLVCFSVPSSERPPSAISSFAWFHLNAAWILKMWSNVKSSISPLLLDLTELCLCCQTCAELTHLHSLSCSHCSTEADKVLHHPDLGRTAGSMGCNRVWGAGGGTGTLLRAWPDTSPFRSITFPLSVLEPPSPFVAFFLLRPI